MHMPSRQGSLQEADCVDVKSYSADDKLDKNLHVGATVLTDRPT